MNTVKLIRGKPTEYGQFGKLYDAMGVLCETLLPDDAFPDGEYELKLVYSNRFSRNYGHDLIWICREPNVTYDKAVHHNLIHVGNTLDDTEGCLLVGNAKNNKQLLGSRIAYQRVYPILKKLIKEDTTMLKVQTK